MKTYYSILLAAFAASGLAHGAATAYTTPVGYVSTVMAPGQFTYVGITLQKPVLAAGVLSGSTSGSVTAGGTTPPDFGTLLSSGSTYILELPDGTIQEVISWSGSTLNTPDDISSLVTNNVTTYKVRLCDTVSSVFGSANSSGLKSSTDGVAATVDNVIVYTSPGASVNIYFYDANDNGLRDEVDGDGWYTADGLIADNQTIPYPDAVIVQRVAGVAKTLTVTGEVKIAPTKSILGSGYNFLSSIAPVGMTLKTSGISGYISTSADGIAATVDNLVLDVAGTSTTTYFYDANQNSIVDVADGDGWYTADGIPADDFVLAGAFYINNIGSSKPYKISIPGFYSNL